MSESDLKNANIAFSNGDLDQCLVYTHELLDENKFDCDALMLQAKVYYKKQDFGDALNCVNRILEKEKSNEIALNYKEMIVNIISFWNKDHYNP